MKISGSIKLLTLSYPAAPVAVSNLFDNPLAL